ncbi:response regulator transcription factor [uncultured Thermanaerothrix sp.]|uniref:response regulator transcription factor n=1 Tax=uncultured Thermanaerothrix sp. TaxID=1195149 RepID=UPI0026319144|nr:response regulator transcription factor [uncultured Thermanaerothrix sp.]
MVLSQPLGADLDEFYSGQRSRIMIVEDDPDTTTLLKQILRTAGFDVLSAANGIEALRKYHTITPDMVLLDLLMPEMDGWETLRQLRQVSTTPVLVLTAVDAKESLMECFHLGADDYLVKPFHRGEVLARINAILRRSRHVQSSHRYVFPNVGLIIESQSREVRYKNERIPLTVKEFEVLSTLAKYAPEVVDYLTLSEAVWGRDLPQARQRIKFLIYLLRRKLGNVDEAGADLIVNVDRLGYKLETGE